MKTLADGANWLFTVFGMAGAVAFQSLRPVTWRRTVLAEFQRFLDLVCVRNLPATLIAAGLVGLILVSEGLYWLEQFGQSDAIGQVIIFVMVREVGPLVVGLLALSSGGIVMLGELSGMRSDGRMDMLDRQGVDPFLLLIVPRTAALIVAVFAHCVIFISVALIVGFAMAYATGTTALSPAEFGTRVLTGIGTTGYLVLPVKSVAIGLSIGVVCGVTAVEITPEEAREAMTARGFVRAISAILLVSTMISLAL